MYRLSGVTKEYGHGAVLALRGVDLEVPDGGRLEHAWSASMVMVTHDSVEAARAQRTGLMRDGQLILAARTSPDVRAVRPRADAAGQPGNQSVAMPGPDRLTA